MAVTIEQGLNPKRMTVGDHIMVRATITAINSTAGAGATYGGAGDTITCLVDTPGNVGEQAGVSFIISPIQCQWRAATYEGH